MLSNYNYVLCLYNYNGFYTPPCLNLVVFVAALLAVKTEEQYGLVLGGCIGVIGSLILIPEMISRFRKKKTKTLN